MLPPAPAAVAAYFERRRRTLAEFTPDDIEHNERLWLETCGVPAPPAPEAQNGGSTVPEVIQVTDSSDPSCRGCGQPFRPRREWSLYCSETCKQRAKRSRRRIAA